MASKKDSTTVSLLNYQADYLRERHSYVSESLNTLIEMYKDLISIEKRDLDLKKNEVEYVFDSLNGIIPNALSVQMLHASIEDSAVYDNLHLKYNVDVKKLSEKIQAMNNLQRLAIVDAAQVFWYSKAPDNIEDVHSYKLRKSGLVREF